MDKILEKNAKIKRRILYFIEIQQITKVDFCEKTGISYSNIKGKAQKSELGGEQIVKILEVYSALSPDWLLLGNGEMLRNSSPVNSGNGQQVIADHNSGTINADNRQYYCDSPDVLRREIELLNEWIKEKDGQIKEKDGQIKEKDGQINELLKVLSQFSGK